MAKVARGEIGLSGVATLAEGFRPSTCVGWRVSHTQFIPIPQFTDKL